jgi:hypothetical protein
MNRSKQAKREIPKTMRTPPREMADAALPKRHPWLLAVSSLSIIAWIVFLAVMAFRH